MRPPSDLDMEIEKARRGMAADAFLVSGLLFSQAGRTNFNALGEKQAALRVAKTTGAAGQAGLITTLARLAAVLECRNRCRFGQYSCRDQNKKNGKTEQRFTINGHFAPP
jgi:hypothetical protein